MKPQLYLQVAVPSPLRSPFDYLPPDAASPRPLPGQRVRVPFGRREVVGLIIGLSSATAVPPERLKRAAAIIDNDAALDADTLALYLWASHYYQFPVGQALQASLPPQVRAGRPLARPALRYWRLTEQGRRLKPAQLNRAPRQKKVVDLLHRAGQLGGEELSELLGASANPFLRALADKSLVQAFELTETAGTGTLSDAASLYGADQPLPLNSEQATAVADIAAQLTTYGCHLLEGVTGSGKTEVYLQLIARVLQAGRQVLVLVPEIGLTPQTISRFRRRFNRRIVTLHSGLSDSERFHAWLQARDGSADIIIGTRSAVFTPLARPGLIIVDEEHDNSFKQQEGFRYSARDLSIYRAHLHRIPVLLGSATPSLESLHNALSGRYSLHRLTQRAGPAGIPSYRFIDLRGESLQEGISASLLAEIRFHLEHGNQVLVFLNRRGFAPALQCHDCGWIAACPRCETSYTLHRNPPGLRCHHCDAQKPLPSQCPACSSATLLAIGMGTERSESVLNQYFAQTDVIRVDRDSTRNREAMGSILEQINSGKPCILIGTQMLAKGHHFPNVTLVAVLDADSGLFSSDFRGQEQMGQLLTQVAGRAGRGDQPGEVLIQTHHVDHPRLNALVSEGYPVFARQLLEERRLAALPPFSHLALLRAEASSRALPESFLMEAQRLCRGQAPRGITVLGPMPAPMEKRAGKFRFQLQLQSPQRNSLHQLVRRLIDQLELHPLGRKVRWSVDIDPLDFS